MSDNFTTIVAFRLDLTWCYAHVENLAPAGNQLASDFLHRFIEDRFRQSSIEFAGPGVAAECVNNARALWYVENLPLALETLKSALADLHLLQFAEIGFWCRAEGFFRNWHPANASEPIGRHFGTDIDALAAEWHRKHEDFRFHVHFVVEQHKRPSGAFGLVKD